MVQILAATPAYGGMITIDFHRSFVAMMNQCRQHGITLASMVTHSGFVSRARNAAAAKVIHDPTYTHLLTIDADMGWPAEAITRLLAFDKDIVGCTYPRRALMPTPQFIGGIEEGSVVENGFCRAIYVGCGFTLIKRRTLTHMAERFPERMHKDDTIAYPVWDLFPSGLDTSTGTAITDDVGFCRLAHSAGLEVWADVACELTHTGPHTFRYGALGNYVLGDEKSS